MTPSPLPSDRSFGVVFIVFFALIGAWMWWKGLRAYPWLLGASALVAAVTLAKPELLRPFNRLWMKLAEVLNRVVSPIVLGAIFFVLFMPIGLFMRLIGRDTMQRRYDPAAASYWIPRNPPGPDPRDLPNQF